MKKRLKEITPDGIYILKNRKTKKSELAIQKKGGLPVRTALNREVY